MIPGEKSPPGLLEFINILSPSTSYDAIELRIMGDFNDLLHASEKTGGRRHPNFLQLEDFQATQDSCDLYDMAMDGYPNS